MSDNDFFIWAKDNIVSDISKQNNSIEPDLETKRIGLGFKPRLPRNWFNYLMKYTTSRLNSPAHCTTAELPAVGARKTGYMLYVTDVDGGKIVYNNGVNWLRIDTNAVVA